MTVDEGFECADESEPTGVEGLLKVLQKEATKQSRQHADRQEETGATRNPAGPVGAYAPAGHDAIDMRMMLIPLFTSVSDSNRKVSGPCGPDV